MDKLNSRRNFLASGAAITSVGLLAGISNAQDAHSGHQKKESTNTGNGGHNGREDHSKMKMAEPPNAATDSEYPR